MTTAIQKAEAVESLLIQGDLSKLTPAERSTYYMRVCESLGLNPLTKPFEYVKLNGREFLYARKDCTEQLRKRDAVSVQIVAREVVNGVYVVTARASLPAGRHDESIGAVPIDNLRGEALANAMMKAETKAKRRVTLSVCGLGMLDETEVESIQDAKPVSVTQPAAKPAPALPVKQSDPPPADTPPDLLTDTKAICAFALRKGWDWPRLIEDINARYGDVEYSVTKTSWKDVREDIRHATIAALSKLPNVPPMDAERVKANVSAWQEAQALAQQIADRDGGSALNVLFKLAAAAGWEGVTNFGDLTLTQLKSAVASFKGKLAAKGGA